MRREFLAAISRARANATGDRRGCRRILNETANANASHESDIWFHADGTPNIGIEEQRESQRWRQFTVHLHHMDFDSDSPYFRARGNRFFSFS